MTIAFLLQDTGQVYGAERATMDLARGLVQHGAKVVVVLIRETRLGLKDSVLERAIRAHGLDVEILATSRRFSMKLVRAIRDVLVRSEADVLHSVGYKADVHGALATAGQVPHVSTAHGWLFRRDIKERFYGWVNLWALRRCDRVVALSTYYEDMLRKEGLRVVRIPSGIDMAEFPERPRRAGTFTVGMMGRFSEEKNHAMLLRAVKHLVEAGVTIDVLLAGDGPLRRHIEAEIARLDLRHVVRLPGYVTREDFLGCVDVVVLCSLIENLPYSVMEAMVASLPVVATRVGGLPDLVDDGKTGYLVDPDDDLGLAAKLGELACHPGLGQQFGRAGRSRIEHSFALDTCVQAHMHLYASL